MSIRIRSWHQIGDPALAIPRPDKNGEIDWSQEIARAEKEMAASAKEIEESKNEVPGHEDKPKRRTRTQRTRTE